MSKAIGMLTVAAMCVSAAFGQHPKLAADPPILRLKPLTAAELEAAKTRAAGQALAGTHREVPLLMKKGKWQKVKGEPAVWRVRVESPGAAAMRLHIARFANNGGSLWIYSPGARELIGPLHEEDVWSDLIYGDTAIVEYAPPAGAKTSGIPPFTIDRISHQFGR